MGYDWNDDTERRILHSGEIGLSLVKPRQIRHVYSDFEKAMISALVLGGFMLIVGLMMLVVIPTLWRGV